jgi:hypothetical protein
MLGWFSLFTFISPMGQHILPKGMQQIRHYRLHARAVCQQVRKKLRAFLPPDAACYGEISTEGAGLSAPP